MDGPSTLTNTLRCPIQYISKIPPSLVTDNYCFICDGEEVSVEEILTECQWWKQTSSSTRFYSSDNMTTFHQVTLLTCRGETRGAYRARVRGGGISKVSLHKVFRVSRVFSSWRTCPGFHRIVSTINPITEGMPANYSWMSREIFLNTICSATDGEKSYNFRKRIFIQYFWRSEKVPCCSVEAARSSYPWISSWMAQGSRDSLGNISPHALGMRTRASLKFQAIAKSLKFARSFGRRQSTSASPVSANHK
ncbi:unnamed protein product [Heligmosomoides polygyrus]|uniref:Uncharacterized protein n=1 Tax=Heligmosomoides polygyrus TaxID=6339 RepID=A0A3P8AH57_HELPZ|nr:unnamed protein product [Heligmosomoides polygyrus]